MSGSPSHRRLVAANVTDLHREQSFLSEMLTQVLNGTELEVLEESDKWCRVRQADGYEGWAYKGFLTDFVTTEPTHIVCSPTALAQSEPTETERPLTRLLAGTNVKVARTQGAWSAVETVGSMLARGWVESNNLRPLAALPLPPAQARPQMLADARKFTGVYYLWGGCTAWGIDCSGLAQLAHRLSGYTIPRDCYLQFPVGASIEPPFQVGDLLYFWNEAKTKVGHVGISTGGWNIIHSSRTKNGVYEENVQQNEGLKASFAGGRSFLPR